MVDQRREIANFYGKLGTNDPLYAKRGESGAYSQSPVVLRWRELMGFLVWCCIAGVVAIILRPHMSLHGMTPTQAAGIELNLGDNRWMSMTEQSVKE